LPRSAEAAPEKAVNTQSGLAELRLDLCGHRAPKRPVQSKRAGGSRGIAAVKSGGIMARMTTRIVAPGRPQAGEYAPFYEKYVALIPGTDILGSLEAQRMVMAQLLGARSEREGNFRYAPDKWSVKEVIGHIADSERIFAYRALRFARGDNTPLSGFEQDDYVKNGGFGERTLADLAEEFTEVRGATIALFSALDAAAWQRRGVANKNEVSVRALAYIIAGHDLHHRRILEEKYLPAIPRA
jgi:hypothetical protein